MVNEIKGLTAAEQRMCAIAGSLPKATGQEKADIWEKAGSVALKTSMGGGVFQVIKATKNPEQREKLLHKTEEIGLNGLLKLGVGSVLFPLIKAGELIDKKIG